MTQSRTVYWSSDDLAHRLRRVEGQIRGVEAMVNRKANCEDILVQLAATQGALAKVVQVVQACRVAEELLAGHEVTDPQVQDVQNAIRRVVR